MFAAEHHVYLCVNPYIDIPDAPDENVLWLFSPDGSLAIEHYKFGGAVIEGTVAGDGILKSVTTDWGTMSGVICWDQDFPHIMRQAGKMRATVMLAPNADWDAITPTHTYMGVFRAVENGYALIRPNVNGLSVITDAYGRVAAAMDHRQTEQDQWMMMGQLPVYQIRTIYSLIGDLFGWLALAGLAGLVSYTQVTNRVSSDLR